MLIGASVNIATTNPFSESSSSGNANLDNTNIYLGGMRHFSTYSNMSGTIVGRSLGGGLSIPFVNFGTSMEVGVTNLSKGFESLFSGNGNPSKRY